MHWIKKVHISTFFVSNVAEFFLNITRLFFTAVIFVNIKRHINCIKKPFWKNSPIEHNYLDFKPFFALQIKNHVHLILSCVLGLSAFRSSVTGELQRQDELNFHEESFSRQTRLGSQYLTNPV